MKEWPVFPILIAVFIVAGSLYGLSRTLQTESSQTIAAQDPPPAINQTAGIPPSASLPQPAIDSPMPATDVASLRAKCVEEARAGRGLSQTLRSACKAFAEASRIELPAARSPPPMPSSPKPRPRPDSGGLAYFEIAVEDCEQRYGYGTIDYRECRARVLKKLRQECRTLHQRADQARGDERQHLKKWARSYCREADRYRVID